MRGGVPPNGSGRQALHRLAGDFGDQVEVLVDVEDGEAPQLGSGGHQEVRDRRRPVAALVGEEQLDFDGAVLDARRQVLHRHGRQWGACDIGPQLGCRPGREAQLQAGDDGDSDQAPLDSLSPLECIRPVAETHVSRFVDQPGRRGGGQLQALAMTSGSLMSANVLAERARSSTVTLTGEATVLVSWRRRYSLRDRPRRWALASMAATT